MADLWIDNIKKAKQIIENKKQIFLENTQNDGTYKLFWVEPSHTLFPVLEEAEKQVFPETARQISSILQPIKTKFMVVMENDRFIYAGRLTFPNKGTPCFNILRRDLSPDGISSQQVMASMETRGYNWDNFFGGISSFKIGDPDFLTASAWGYMVYIKLLAEYGFQGVIAEFNSASIKTISKLGVELEPLHHAIILHDFDGKDIMEDYDAVLIAPSEQQIASYKDLYVLLNEIVLF